MNKEDFIKRTCCFLGHRRITVTDNLKDNLTNIIENLIKNEGIDTFLFGSKSEFNDLCYLIVSKLRENYPHIKRVYIRAEYRNIDDNYRKYLLERYEDTYYPAKIFNAGKASYVERNREMIVQSNLCVFYYKNDYSITKNHRKTASGTKLSYDFAKSQGKHIINILNI